MGRVCTGSPISGLAGRFYIDRIARVCKEHFSPELS